MATVCASFCNAKSTRPATYRRVLGHMPHTNRRTHQHAETMSARARIVPTHGKPYYIISNATHLSYAQGKADNLNRLQRNLQTLCGQRRRTSARTRSTSPRPGGRCTTPILLWPCGFSGEGNHFEAMACVKC